MRINKQTTKELDILYQALALDPNNSFLMIKIGRCYRELNMVDKACEFYHKAININPNEGCAYANLAIAYLITNRPNEALPYFQKALQLLPPYSPDYPGLLANYGNCLGRLGYKQDAERLFLQAERAGYDTNLLNNHRNQVGIKPKKRGLFF